MEEQRFTCKYLLFASIKEEISSKWKKFMRKYYEPF